MFLYSDLDKAYGLGKEREHSALGFFLDGDSVINAQDVQAQRIPEGWMSCS